MHSVGDRARHARRRRVVAAVLAGAAALAVGVGSFGVLFTGSVTTGGRRFSMVITSWGFEVDGGSRSGAVPTGGYVLVLAAVLLLATAVLSARSVGYPAPALPPVTALVAVAAVAFLTAAVWMTGLQVLSFADSLHENAAALPGGPGVTVLTDTGPGFWLLIGSVVLAGLAAVLVLRSTKLRDPAQLQADLTTPRHGFLMPSPYGPRPPVQPSWGAPASVPHGLPTPSTEPVPPTRPDSP